MDAVGGTDLAAYFEPALRPDASAHRIDSGVDRQAPDAGESARTSYAEFREPGITVDLQLMGIGEHDVDLYDPFHKA
jgi:hypothetical protein